MKSKEQQSQMSDQGEKLRRRADLSFLENYHKKRRLKGPWHSRWHVSDLHSCAIVVSFRYENRDAQFQHHSQERELAATWDAEEHRLLSTKEKIRSICRTHKMLLTRGRHSEFCARLRHGRKTYAIRRTAVANERSRRVGFIRRAIKGSFKFIRISWKNQNFPC